MKPSPLLFEELPGDPSIARAPLRPNRLLRSFLLVSLLFSLCVGQALAEETIFVLYPEAPAPYNDFFSGIVKGMKAGGGADFEFRALAKDYDPHALDESLRSEGAGGLVLLGKRGYKASKAIGSELPKIFGALRVAPRGLSGISLCADPDVLFDHLRSIAPGIERVLVVYSPGGSDWLIPLAEKSAKKRGLELIAIEAEDLQDAARSYWKFLRGMDPKTDSIWLPLDPVTVNDKVVLPMLLKDSWDRGLVVFSSKASHAKRGVLFSTVPDNVGMGRDLAAMAVDRVEGSAEPGALPVTALRLAVNLRTADHLGLRFTPEQSERFDLTFSSR